MSKRDPDLSKALQGGGQFVPPLALEFATAGGRQKLQCWNTEGIFRLIQSIPSPKVEPLKRWLARVGKERIDEIDNPELAMGRMQELYEKKGYPKEWISSSAIMAMVCSTSPTSRTPSISSPRTSSGPSSQPRRPTRSRSSQTTRGRTRGTRYSRRCERNWSTR